MAYIPPHKRSSKESDALRPTPFLSLEQKRNPRQPISKTVHSSLATSIDSQLACSVQLKEFPYERKDGKQPMILVSPDHLQKDDISPDAGFSTLKILTYNVWFREDLEMYKRMNALGDLIQQHSPDVICFQEVTANIYGIFQKSSWWKAYRCSVSAETSELRSYFCMQLSKLPVKSFGSKPFRNSIMGRELCMTEVDLNAGKTLVVATSHLESLCIGPPTWDQTYSKERIAQAQEAVTSLSSSPNVIFGGDMNWDDKLDGKFPISDGWVDAWAVLKPGEDGFTYDTKCNQMLSGNRKLQKR